MIEIKEMVTIITPNQYLYIGLEEDEREDADNIEFIFKWQYSKIVLKTENNKYIKRMLY